MALPSPLTCQREVKNFGGSCCELVIMTGFFTSLQVWRGCWWNWRAGRYTQVPGRSPLNNDFFYLSVRLPLATQPLQPLDCNETACTWAPFTIHPSNRPSLTLPRCVSATQRFAHLSDSWPFCHLSNNRLLQVNFCPLFLHFVPQAVQDWCQP